MLHRCNALLKQLYNLDLTFKENWPKKAELVYYKIIFKNSCQSSFRYKSRIRKSLDTLFY